MKTINISIVLIFVISLIALFSCDSRERFRQAAQKSIPVDTASAKKEKPKVPSIEIAADSVKEILTAYGNGNPEKMVMIRTRFGDMKVRLYEETPLHRANFVMLAKKKFYDEGEFNRVIKDFMIQGGDSDDRKMKISKYNIPMELNSKYFHKKGALAMANFSTAEGSSSHYFFIIQGTKLSDPQLNAVEKEFKIKLTPAQRQAYKTVGGMPALDGKYTVFGEVVEGKDVIDKIASVKTDKNDWPLKEVDIKMEVLE